VVEHRIYIVVKGTSRERNRKRNKALGLLKLGQAKIIWESYKFVLHRVGGIKEKSLN